MSKHRDPRKLLAGKKLERCPAARRNVAQLVDDARLVGCRDGFAASDHRVRRGVSQGLCRCHRSCVKGGSLEASERTVPEHSARRRHKVTYRDPEGEERVDTVRVIDWNQPQANDFLLVSQPRFPDPISLRSIYGQGPAPQPTRLRPYSQQHPRYMTPALNIPAAENIEANVTAFTKVIAQARKIFKLIAPLDYRFPQANPAIPLSEKPRMEIWSDGSDYYPGLFTKKILGLTIPGRTLEATPEPAIEAFKSGQLLAYLAESGVANPLLTPGTWHGEDAVVLDLRHLERGWLTDSPRWGGDRQGNPGYADPGRDR